MISIRWPTGCRPSFPQTLFLFSNFLSSLPFHPSMKNLKSCLLQLVRKPWRSVSIVSPSDLQYFLHSSLWLTGLLSTLVPFSTIGVPHRTLFFFQDFVWSSLGGVYTSVYPETRTGSRTSSRVEPCTDVPGLTRRREGNRVTSGLESNVRRRSRSFGNKFKRHQREGSRILWVLVRHHTHW